MKSHMQENKLESILTFWFEDLKDGEMPPEEKMKMWWEKDEATDEYIRTNFESDLLSAMEGGLQEWKDSPRGILAFIILLDQFSRNIYRGLPAAFSQDSIALKTSARGIEKGFDKDLHPAQRVFFYMPYMHSEDIRMQEKSLQLFRGLEKEFKTFPKLLPALSENRKYAEAHYDIIKRFGRYPHRNEILGRESTSEELEFLKQPGSSF
jgi:uncharacterized protein (DUF924 family)